MSEQPNSSPLPHSSKPDLPQKEMRSRGGLPFFGFLCLTLLLLLDLKDFHSPYKGFLLHIVALCALFPLAILFAQTLPRAMLSKQYHMRRGTREPKQWFLLHAVSSGGSIALLLLWLSGGVFGENTARYQSLLHAGMLVGMVAFAMGFRRVYFWWKIFDLTPGRFVFFLYGGISLLGAILLILPWSLQPNQKVSFIDSVFLAVSAISVTGLVPVNVATTFTHFGQSVILALIQAGGMGIVLLSVSLLLFTRSRLSLYHTQLGSQELSDVPNLGGLKPFVRKFIFFTIFVESVSVVFMYLFLPKEIPNRLFHAVFHTISSFCNAGFSSFENNLEVPGLVAFKGLAVVLVILGGLGFHVIVELMDRFMSPAKKRLSADTILTLRVTLSLFFVGTFLIFFSELFNPQSVQGFWERLGHAIFFSANCRTAGLSSMSVESFHSSSTLVMSLLMIIGGSSLSTAGGIKVSTFGILIVSALSLFRGHKWIQFRTSEVSFLVLQKCVAVVIVYFTVLFASLLIVTAIENIEPLLITFELISALSTVGLSLGVTAKVGAASKAIIILLMLVGRLGLVSIVYVGIGKITEQRFRYASDRFFVG